jgi:RNA polymerase sigma-70 factor (ECF subfamily)
MSDAELIERLKAKDSEAYREVLNLYGDALYRYVYRLSGDSQLSEDVVGETYLRLVERIDEFIYTGAPLKAWLYRVAHNLAINASRREGRLRPSSDLDLEPAGPNSDPAAEVGSQLEAEDLRAALGQLTEDQQQVLTLRFFAGQSSSETAQALDKSEVAVRQLQLRALRALGRILGHE